MDRYTLTKTPEELAERFAVEKPEGFQPTYNVFPSRLMPVITLQGKGGFSYFYWGLHPGMSRNKSLSPKLYNAFAEEMTSRISFQNALQTNRCIIPADGYYTWKQVSRKGNIPYRITRADGRCFTFAGLWEEFEDPSGEMVHTFKVITTTAPSSMRHLGDTVPVILEEQGENAWLDADTPIETLSELLKPIPESDLYIYSVSPRINHQNVDSPSLIKPAPAADQFGNYSLFD